MFLEGEAVGGMSENIWYVRLACNLAESRVKDSCIINLDGTGIMNIIRYVLVTCSSNLWLSTLYVGSYYKSLKSFFYNILYVPLFKYL